MDSRFVPRFMAAMVVASLGAAMHAPETIDDLAAQWGRPADVAPSAHEYRADRSPDQNSPESWILLVQYAGLPYDRPPETYFDTSDQNAHTWWNPLTKTRAGPPEVSADGRTCVFAIPRDTWGVVVSVGGDKEASVTHGRE